MYNKKRLLLYLPHLPANFAVDIYIYTPWRGFKGFFHVFPTYQQKLSTYTHSFIYKFL